MHSKAFIFVSVSVITGGFNGIKILRLKYDKSIIENNVYDISVHKRRVFVRNICPLNL